MFADEARFGRMNRPRPCWAPAGVRPKVACQLVREFIYLYGAISPKDGASAFLILPSSDAECFQIFLDALAKKFSRSHILLIVDGAGNHKSGELAIPANVTLARLPAHSPELNPQENTGTRSGRRSSKTTPPNPWTRSAKCSWRAPSISNATQS
jgi:transposase